jgi:hypothetical protein
LLKGLINLTIQSGARYRDFVERRARLAPKRSGSHICASPQPDQMADGRAALQCAYLEAGLSLVTYFTGKIMFDEARSDQSSDTAERADSALLDAYSRAVIDVVDRIASRRFP